MNIKPKTNRYLGPVIYATHTRKGKCMYLDMYISREVDEGS